MRPDRRVTGGKRGGDCWNIGYYKVCALKGGGDDIWELWLEDGDGEECEDGDRVIKGELVSRLSDLAEGISMNRRSGGPKTKTKLIAGQLFPSPPPG